MILSSKKKKKNHCNKTKSLWLENLTPMKEYPFCSGLQATSAIDDLKVNSSSAICHSLLAVLRGLYGSEGEHSFGARNSYCSWIRLRKFCWASGSRVSNLQKALKGLLDGVSMPGEVLGKTSFLGRKLSCFAKHIKKGGAGGRNVVLTLICSNYYDLQRVIC